MICCILEMQWTVLAQTMTAPVTGPLNICEAAAANKAWSTLSRTSALELGIEDEAIKKNILATIQYALQCFGDLASQIEEMDSDPNIDTYAWETMSESLVSLSPWHNPLLSHPPPETRLCVLSGSTRSGQVVAQAHHAYAQQQLVYLGQHGARSSSEGDHRSCSKVCHPLTLITLKLTRLAPSFPSIAPEMTMQLRRFVTSPLPLFQFEFAAENRTAPPLSAAAKCLALCIKVNGVYLLLDDSITHRFPPAHAWG